MSLEREEQQHEAKLGALRAAIDEGDASGIAEGDVFARVREKLKIPATFHASIVARDGGILFRR